MKFNIDRLRLNEACEVSFSEIMPIPREFGVVDDKTNVFVDAMIKNEGDYFTFIGKGVAKVALECALCLNPVLTNLEFDIDDKYSQNFDSLGDEDVWMFDAKEMDLNDALLAGLLIAIPTKVVCRVDCKGICSGCGVNLNDSVCGCQTKSLDERFSVLDNLFKDKK